MLRVVGNSFCSHWEALAQLIDKWMSLTSFLFLSFSFFLFNGVCVEDVELVNMSIHSPSRHRQTVLKLLAFQKQNKKILENRVISAPYNSRFQ